jgi:urease accessory protein
MNTGGLGTENGIAVVRFRAGIGGEPVVHDLVSSASYTFEAAPWGAWIIGSAAHPVVGDHLALKVSVGVGCCAELRSYAPTVARRGPLAARPGAPQHSSTAVSVTVSSDAMFTWRPEPSIAAKGCDHRNDASVQLASNARLLWRDEFILERRHDEAPGTWRSRLRISRDGWPVTCSEFAIGPASALWESPAVLEGARAVSVMVVVDPGRRPEAWAPARANRGSATGVALPLSTPGVQIVAWGDDLADCRSAIEAMLAKCGVPAWARARWQIGMEVERPDLRDLAAVD